MVPLKKRSIKTPCHEFPCILNTTYTRSPSPVFVNRNTKNIHSFYTSTQFIQKWKEYAHSYNELQSRN